MVVNPSAEGMLYVTWGHRHPWHGMMISCLFKPLKLLA